MKKLFLAVCSMIVTGFLMKSYRKLREKPETEEEVYRRMRAAYARVRRRAELDAKNATFNRMDAISTPRDGGLMSSIDALQQMAPRGFM